MTEDVTRGLTLLADEAEPAPIDPQEVITRARTRTRRRTAVAAAFAAVTVVGALVATLGQPGEPTTATAPPERLVDRLNRQLTEALPGLIPDNWVVRDSPLQFQCDVSEVLDSGAQEPAPFCQAYTFYDDGVGAIDLSFSIDKRVRSFDDATCPDPQYCTQWEPPSRRDLADGTRTQVTTFTEKPTSRNYQELRATRPDGTQIRVSVIWPQGQRAETPLTTDEILRFAAVFDYGDAVAPTAPPTSTPKSDPKKAARLDDELHDVLAEVIPDGWTRVADDQEPEETQFSFDCTESKLTSGIGGETKTVLGCWTAGYYRDAVGEVGFKFSVDPLQIFGGDCTPADCVEQTLPDGTRAEIKNEYAEPITTYSHSVSAFRPDGTVIWVEVFWQGQRAQTPLTDEQLLKFATAFTY